MRLKLGGDMSDAMVKKWWMVGYLAMMGCGWVDFGAAFVRGGESVEKMMLAGYAGMASVFGVLLYFCAYRKPGTRWLSYILISAIIELMRNANDMMHLFFATPFDGMSFGELITIFVRDGLYCGWLYLCFKLWKVNKALAPPPPVSGEIELVIAEMGRAKSREDLDAVMRDGIVKFPRFEPALSREYKKIRESLVCEM